MKQKKLSFSQVLFLAARNKHMLFESDVAACQDFSSLSYWLNEEPDLLLDFSKNKWKIQKESLDIKLTPTQIERFLRDNIDVKIASTNGRYLVQDLVSINIWKDRKDRDLQYVTEWVVDRASTNLHLKELLEAVL